mgnify:CR=1 FL=1
MGELIKMKNIFAFQFMNLYGIDKNKRAEKLSIAAHQATTAINSDEFELWFLSTVFTQLTDEQKKLTNSELLNIMRTPVVCDYSVVPKPWYKRWTSVIGWTVFTKRFLFSIGWRSIPQVTTYSDHFDSMSIAGLSGHLSHELAFHGNGASHSYEWSKQRDLSLPYQCGNWIESNASKLS